jgi:hypothetical protein
MRNLPGRIGGLGWKVLIARYLITPNRNLLISQAERAAPKLAYWMKESSLAFMYLLTSIRRTLNIMLGNVPSDGLVPSTVDKLSLGCVTCEQCSV